MYIDGMFLRICVHHCAQHPICFNVYKMFRIGCIFIWGAYRGILQICHALCDNIYGIALGALGVHEGVVFLDREL